MTSEILFACAVLAALSSAAPAAAQSGPADITITQADNGKEITLRRNQRLIIRLANPLGDSGYGWSALMSPNSPLGFAEKQPAPPKPDQTPGAPRIGGEYADTIIAFRPVRYTESYSQRFTLIYCRFDCDLRADGAKIFWFAITTRK